MRYVLSRQWSLREKFEITDQSGAPQFEARGHLGSRITLHDQSGREVAEIRKHAFTLTHEIYLDGQRAAEVRHAGFIGNHYDVETSYGPLAARGHFGGGDYTLSRGGVTVATMVRNFSLREKFAVDIADGENDAFLLAVMLTIEAIHTERRERQSR
jgi:uncharacterized protein YxjI